MEPVEPSKFIEDGTGLYVTGYCLAGFQCGPNGTQDHTGNVQTRHIASEPMGRRTRVGQLGPGRPEIFIVVLALKMIYIKTWLHRLFGYSLGVRSERGLPAPSRPLVVASNGEIWRRD